MASHKDNLTIHNIDLHNFSFTFASVLNDKEAFSVFFSFQKQEYNTEPMLFVQECLDLEKIPYPEKKKDAIALALHIFDSYVSRSVMF